MNDLFPSRRSLMNLNRGFFNDTFDNFFSNSEDFSVDIKEKEDAYTLEADLPGLTKEDIQLDYTNNVLSISAHQETNKEEKDDEGNYIRRERSSRSYSRQFLIKNVDEDAIKASFENGVLTVDLPKKEEDTPETKKIEIQ
ncbi:18 kDa heat shock protein [Jeotgalibaca dankookensis]|uniref:18 kDa heat shock protein n=1 Tax=Jeotgalibaca dankookensis TaxID=708126 RepID=A0A1S6INZ5_9LACT|nr:Hsp20/alpha crystallin family protein [Jeotgalibaca dankookensis]AQS53278.1 18 kDa heat shock protein [Jeotgalibaca dankookensis]